MYMREFAMEWQRVCAQVELHLVLDPRIGRCILTAWAQTCLASMSEYGYALPHLLRRLYQ
jgi:hypothetical protein